MLSIGRDFSYSFRSLLKRPGFALIAVLTLAVGIGANTTIFSVVKSVLLQPLPYENSEQLVWIWESNERNDIPFEPASVPNFYDWKEQNQVFSDMAAFVPIRRVLTASGDAAEQIPAGLVTPNLFSMLGRTPALGRSFNDQEGFRGGDRVVILSDGLWHRRFGGDPSILGSKIILDGNPSTVIGVMPAGYRHLDMDGARPTQLWVPMQFDPTTRNRRSDFLRVVARLEPTADLGRARADLQTIASRLEEEYPATNSGWSVTLVSLEERFSGDVRTSLLVLLAAVAFLLLIACANVANLQLTRATSRQREVAIRVALGAGRWRLMRQFLAEATILGVAGGAAGLALAVWGVDLLLALRPAELPLINDVKIDGTVLAFTIVLSLTTSLLFGIVPALLASRPDIRGAMQSGGRDGGDKGLLGRRVRQGLVVAEIAIALLMLIGAGLMVRSLHQMIQVDPGVSTEGVITASLGLPRASYDEDHKIQAFYGDLLREVAALPNVRAAAITTDLPLSGGGNFWAFGLEGVSLGPADPQPDALITQTSPGYFQTVGITLVEGRLIADTDRSDAPVVMVVNRTLARRYWPDRSPIGQRVTFDGQDTENWVEIVGVVSDVFDEALDVAPFPQMYGAHAQFNNRYMSLVVRAHGDPMALVSDLRRTVTRIDANIPLNNIKSMSAIVAESMAQKRFSMILLSLFAGLALLLAAIGIYGVISFSVSQRTREFGVRMALGARRSDVHVMVMRGGMALAFMGIVIGLGFAFGLTRLMSSLIFGVNSSDPITFVGIALLLTCVAGVASYIPAWRATRVDPLIALRYE